MLTPGRDCKPNLNQKINMNMSKQAHCNLDKLVSVLSLRVICASFYCFSSFFCSVVNWGF